MLRVARPLQLESAAGAYLVLNRGNYRAGPHSPLVTAGREGSISSRASSDETVKAQQNCSRAISKNDKGATGWPPLSIKPFFARMGPTRHSLGRAADYGHRRDAKLRNERRTRWRHRSN